MNEEVERLACVNEGTGRWRGVGCHWSGRSRLSMYELTYVIVGVIFALQSRQPTPETLAPIPRLAGVVVASNSSSVVDMRGGMVECDEQRSIERKRLGCRFMHAHEG